MIGNDTTAEKRTVVGHLTVDIRTYEVALATVCRPAIANAAVVFGTDPTPTEVRRRLLSGGPVTDAECATLRTKPNNDH